MRDLIAGLVALGLVIAAASLATTLRFYRRRREGKRAGLRSLGRTIVAEIPAGDDLAIFSEDDRNFYYGDRTFQKSTVVAARVLINGIPIASAASSRAAVSAPPSDIEDPSEGIARDRWDVAIDTLSPDAPPGTLPTVVSIECGAIRERVSQELARAVFDAVKRDIERLNR